MHYSLGFIMWLVGALGIGALIYSSGEPPAAPPDMNQPGLDL